jgi:hypothetical protein
MFEILMGRFMQDAFFGSTGLFGHTYNTGFRVVVLPGFPS